MTTSTITHTAATLVPLTDLCAALAQALAMPTTTVEGYARTLRAAGFIPIGRAGRGGAGRAMVTTAHAADMLLAILAADTASTAPLALAHRRCMRLGNIFAGMEATDGRKWREPRNEIIQDPTLTVFRAPLSVILTDFIAAPVSEGPVSFSALRSVAVSRTSFRATLTAAALSPETDGEEVDFAFEFYGAPGGADEIASRIETTANRHAAQWPPPPPPASGIQVSATAGTHVFQALSDLFRRHRATA